MEYKSYKERPLGKQRDYNYVLPSAVNDKDFRFGTKIIKDDKD